MNTEDIVAKRIVATLDRSLGGLDPQIQTRLQLARRAALEHQRAHSSGLSLAGVGRTLTDLWSTHSRLAMVTLTAILMLVAADTLRDSVMSSELEEVDSALLSDDLPIDAYLDHGFDRWLKPDDSAS
ncbi:DUF3619 family protein [Niveibacterium sp.]|uniref:DUF3619 family protein n=1 Tax=Niveibacterium sp. TaxID=2017444 RepID=UPI0035B1B7D8